jgi:hypothetical protein
MHSSLRQHATRIFDGDRGSRAQPQLTSTTDKARVTHAHSFSTIATTSLDKFYSNRRRATLMFEFCVARIFRERFVLMSTRAEQRYSIQTSIARAPSTSSAVCSRESARHVLSRASAAACLPGKVYSDKRVTLVQSCEQAILRIIRHANSR